MSSTPLNHYVYKTTNTKNGMYYIGKRSTNKDPPKDTYLGSGLRLKRAIKKYGREFFSKEILFLCSSESDAYALEAKLVTQAQLDDPMCYNCKQGGLGAGLGNKNTLGHKLSEEHKQKIGAASRGCKCAPFSKEHREKIASSHRGKPLTEEHKAKIGSSLKGGKRSNETRSKMSASAKNIPAETRALMKERMHTPKRKMRPPISEETRKKRSESMKKFHAQRKQSQGTLLANHFHEKGSNDGGTATGMTDAELVAALRVSFHYWKNKALIAE